MQIQVSILGFDFIVFLIVVEFVLQGVMPLNKRLETQSINLVEANRESQVRADIPCRESGRRHVG